MTTIAGLAVREAGPPDGRPVLLLHGWPESSHMWVACLEALSARGLRAIAPDLPGHGCSEVRRPGTWATHVAAVGALADELGLSADRPAALIVHDWGGLIGLRWACDHPGLTDAHVISDTGFFADGRWHGLARAMRTPGEGEELVAGWTRDTFGQLLGAVSKIDAAGVDEHWRSLATPEHRAAALELYRSGEFAELAAYDGRLAALDVDTLVLWGEDDPFAPLAGAERFVAELPRARLEVLPGTGHFAPEDDPAAYASSVARFLAP